MKIKTWELFLDDVRDAWDPDHVVARNVKEAKELIEKKGCPEFISFDHDLGENETAMDLINWMIEKDLNDHGKFIPQNFGFFVHSANPVGSQNIIGKLSNYLKQRGNIS